MECDETRSRFIDGSSLEVRHYPGWRNVGMFSRPWCSICHGTTSSFSTAVYVQKLAPSDTYLCLAFDRNSLVASYRLVFFSDALHLSLGTSRTHHHCSLGRCHPHTVVLSHTRTHSSSLTHAFVATNCSVLNHSIGSIIGFTLLLGLEIEMF